jgi:hypothetical protein
MPARIGGVSYRISVEVANARKIDGLVKSFRDLKKESGELNRTFGKQATKSYREADKAIISSSKLRRDSLFALQKQLKAVQTQIVQGERQIQRFRKAALAASMAARREGMRAQGLRGGAGGTLGTVMLAQEQERRAAQAKAAAQSAIAAYQTRKDKIAQLLRAETAIEDSLTKRRIKSAEDAAKRTIAARKKEADKTKQLIKQQREQYEKLSTFVGTAGLGLLATKTAGLLKGVTLLAGRTENLQTIMENVGANAHYAAVELGVLERQVVRLGITTRHARESITLLARNNLDLSKTTQLARIAQDAAVIAGENSSRAFEKLAISVQRLDTRLLRNRGILINLRNLYQRMAIATGRVETTLAAMNDVYKQYTSLDRVIEQAKIKLGDQFIPVFQAVVDIIGWLAKGFEKNYSTVHALTAAFATLLTVTTSLAVALTALRYAWLAFTATSMATPFGWIAAGIGAVATALVYLSAQARNASENLNKQNAEVAETISTMVDLRHAVEEFDRLKKASDGSLEAITRQNIALDNLRATARLAGVEIGVLAGETEILNALWTYDKTIFQTEEHFLRDVRQLIAYRGELVKEAEARLLELTKGPAGRGGTSGAELGRLPAIWEAREQLAELRALYDQAVKTEKTYWQKLDVIRLRELDKQHDRQQVAHQLALRAGDGFRRERVKQHEDAGLEILADLEEYQKKLTTSYMSEEDILQRSALAMRERVKQLEKNYEQQLKAADEAGNAAALSDTQAEIDGHRAVIQQDIREETFNELKARREIEQAQEEAVRISRLRLEDEIEEVRLLEERNRLIEEGVSSDVIDNMQKRGVAQKELRAAEATYSKQLYGDQEKLLRKQEQYGEVIQRLRTYEKDFAKARRDFADANQNDRKAEAIAAQKRMEDLQEQMYGVQGLTLAESQLKAEIVALEKGLFGLRERYTKDVQAGVDNQQKLNDVLEKIRVAEEGLANARRRYWVEHEVSLREELELRQREAEQAKETIEQIQAEIAELEGDTTARTAQEVRNRIDERKREFEAVKDFIRSTRLELKEEELPGISDVTRVFDNFMANIQKSRNRRQIEELAELFPERLKLALDKASKEAQSLAEKIVQKRAELRRKYFQMGGGMEFAQKTAKDQRALLKMIVEYRQLQDQVRQRDEYATVIQDRMNTLVGERIKALEELRAEEAHEQEIMETTLENLKGQLVNVTAVAAKENEAADAAERRLKAYQGIMQNIFGAAGGDGASYPAVHHMMGGGFGAGAFGPGGVQDVDSIIDLVTTTVSKSVGEGLTRARRIPEHVRAKDRARVAAQRQEADLLNSVRQKRDEYYRKRKEDLAKQYTQGREDLAKQYTQGRMDRRTAHQKEMVQRRIRFAAGPLPSPFGGFGADAMLGPVGGAASESARALTALKDQAKTAQDQIVAAYKIGVVAAEKMSKDLKDTTSTIQRGVDAYEQILQ